MQIPLFLFQKWPTTETYFPMPISVRWFLHQQLEHHLDSWWLEIPLFKSPQPLLASPALTASLVLTFRNCTNFLENVMLHYEVIYVNIDTNCLNCSSFIADYNQMVDMLQERSVIVNTVVIIGSILPRWCLTTVRILSA